MWETRPSDLSKNAENVPDVVQVMICIAVFIKIYT